MLKDKYKIMNKVIHYNLHPKGSEKQPSITDIEFLHIMMSGMYFLCGTIYVGDDPGV